MKKFLTLILAGLFVLTACPDPGNGNNSGGGGGGTYDYPSDPGGGYYPPSPNLVGTITGTITLTDVPSPAPEVEICVYGNNDYAYWNRSYSKIDISGSGTLADISWSIPIYRNNNFFASTCYFELRIEMANGNSFNIYIPTTPYISSANDNVGSLGTVSIKSIALNGTVNFTANVPVSYVSIDVYGETYNEDYGGYLSTWLGGSPRFESPDSNAQWTITIPALNSSHKVSFSVVGYSTNGNFLFARKITPSPAVNIDAYSTVVSGINLNLGNINIITISGTINVTYNGQAVEYVNIEVRDASSNRFGSTRLELPGFNAPWSIAREELNSSTQLTFYVSGSTYDRTWFYKEITPSPEVNVYNTNVSGINLNVGFITLSGTINVTYDWQTVDYVQISAYGEVYDEDYGDYLSTQLGYTRLDSPGSNAPWSITMSVLDYSTQVSFSVYGYSVNRESFGKTIIPNPPITINADSTNISGINLNLGNIVTDIYYSIYADGNPTQTTTQLTLSFSHEIDGLTADDITLSGVDGVEKGNLSGSGSTYTLPISGFTNGGTLSVSVSKSGYNIINSQETVEICQYTPPIAVTFNSLTANGNATLITTELTLNFSQAITGLTAGNITLSGVSGVHKGELSGSGSTYTLPISGFLNSGTLYVSVSKSGYDIGDSSKSVYIFYYMYTPPSVGIIINVDDINEWQLTEQTAQATPGVNKTFTVIGTYATYRWYLDGVSVGASSSYIFNKPVGVYQLVVVVTNSNGESRSGRCWITVK